MDSEPLMPENKTPVTRSSMPSLNEYISEIAPLWESHWLTNMGEKHQLLEMKLKEFLKVDNIALFTNGHSALECVLEAFELRGEVITTPFSFVSTTNAIVRKGLTPVFADIKKDDYTLDPDTIESLITPATCAILPVHVYGNICEVEKIQTIAERHNLKVIYDAAHAFGVEKNGVSSACFGDASMFSFHATKVFNTIEGGAICFRDPALKNALNSWKNFGITGPESVEFIGGNAKMNEFCAAMGLCNLRHLNEEITKRAVATERYLDNLKNTPGIKIYTPPKTIKHNYSYMPILFEDNSIWSRDEVFETLSSSGIFSRKYFYPLITDFDCYKKTFESSQTPVAKHVADRILTLPLYADLPLSEIDRICSIIKTCAK